MRTDLAVIAAGLSIAAVIGLTNRWEIARGPDIGGISYYRLDRWTGVTEVCGMDETAWNSTGAIVYTCPDKRMLNARFLAAR